MEKGIPNEGYMLLKAIFEVPKKEEWEEPKKKKYHDIQISNMSEELFPPCIHNIFKGMQDGKKRALFILVNFLKSVGWDADKIEQKVKEWNEKNPDPLREVVMLGHLRHHLSKGSVLPPNCDNKPYYQDLRICEPNNLCRKIKNPVQYAKRRAFFANQDAKKDDSDKASPVPHEDKS